MFKIERLMYWLKIVLKKKKKTLRLKVDCFFLIIYFSPFFFFFFGCYLILILIFIFPRLSIYQEIHKIYKVFSGTNEIAQVFVDLYKVFQ